MALLFCDNLSGEYWRMHDIIEGGNRPWEELIPDALTLIFKKIPFQEILTVIPRVCKSCKGSELQHQLETYFNTFMLILVFP